MGDALRSRHDAPMRSERRRARHAPAAVLIVEDDPIVAEAVAHAIEAIGYRTIRAGSAWEALEALKQGQPALLLVDLSLPGTSGSELLRCVRNDSTWSRIPRVIMTGTNDPMISVRQEAPVFYKPLDMRSLVEVVQRYCTRARPRVSAVVAPNG